MNIKLTRTLLLLLLGLACYPLSAQNVQEVVENGSEELINSYHPSEFYHQNVQIPPGLENSDKREDKINVAIHYKIVAYEQEAQIPINSLKKNELEATLARFQAEALEELGYAEPPREAAEPAPKPAIIHGENR